MVLVDTNVLVDVLEDDPTWADWSIAQLRAQSKVHPLAINALIYAELSLTFSRFEVLDQTLAAMEIQFLDIPRPALFLAGKAFAQYRKRSGKKTNVLADFFIGAHAAVARCPLLTRDTQRYSSYFSGVKLICPEI